MTATENDNRDKQQRKVSMKELHEAVEAEREACAKLAEHLLTEILNDAVKAKLVAKTIRGRR